MNLYQPTITGSLAVSGSVIINGPMTVVSGSLSGTASLASTASSADNFLVRNTLTAQTLVVQTVTSSIIYSSGSNVFGNSSSNRQQMTGSVLVSGSLGIGVSSTDKDLQVRGNNTNTTIRVDVTGSGSPNLTLTTLGQQDWGIGVDFTDSGKLKFDGSTTVGATTKMTLTNAGNLGIGTTTPSFPLDVNTTTTGLIGRFTSNQNEAQIRLVNTSTGGRSYSLGSGGTSSGGARGFYIYDETGGFTAFAITGSGNIGIGTSSPAHKLDVSGDRIRVKSTGTYGGFIADNTGGTGGGFFSANKNGVGIGYFGVSGAILGDTSENLILYNDASTAIVFSTSNTERLRLTSTGTVVAGATGNTPTGTDNSAYLWVASQNRMYINAVGGGCATFGRASTTGNIMGFDYNGGGVGNISTNGSTITFSGTAVSDARYKEDIQPIVDALDTINQIDFVTFKYKENGHDSAGVTSQQIQTIEKLAPFVIDGVDEESYKAFDYNALIGYLGKAIQELKADNDAIRAELAALKS